MQPLKIMLVTRVWPTMRPGGMPHVAQDRAKALAKAGHDVLVVTTSCPKITKRGKNNPPPADVCRVVYGKAPEMVWSEEFVDDIFRAAADFNPDIIHSDSFDRKNPWWLIHGAPAGPIKACTMHGFTWGAWLTKRNIAHARGAREPAFPADEIRQERDALDELDCVMAVSKWEHRMLRDHMRLKRAKLVYNPIGDFFFDTPMPPAPGDRVLLAAFNGHVERGYAAAKAACDSLDIVPLQEKTYKREEMVSQYDRAAVLLLPTFYAQGYDLCVAEARARGVPAIMGATGSYLDEADPQWDRLVEPGCKDSIVKALRAFHDQSDPLMKRADNWSAYKHHPAMHAEAWLDALSIP